MYFMFTKQRDITLLRMYCEKLYAGPGFKSSLESRQWKGEVQLKWQDRMPEDANFMSQAQDFCRGCMLISEA